MWPWEHAILGYLVYSLFARVYYHDSPDALEVVAVVFASVLPEIIDKPLAWEFGVFDSGYELGHSIFFAIPLSIVVGLVARRLGRGPAGVAFGVGYLLHSPADVFYHYVSGTGEVNLAIMLWPVETVESPAEQNGFVDEFWRLFSRYGQDLLAGELSTYMWAQLGLAGFVFLVWLADGAPVIRECLVGAKRLVTPR